MLRKVKTWRDALDEKSTDEVVIDHTVGSWVESEDIRWRCPKCKITFMIPVNKEKYLDGIVACAYCRLCKKLYHFVPRIGVEEKSSAPVEALDDE